MSIKALYHQAAYVRWHTASKALASQVPRQWHTWLYDKGSLTKRLMQLSGGHFFVEVISNQWGYPSPSEAMALGVSIRHKAIIREVKLLGYNTPWVIARSIIPASTLVGRQRLLKSIGNQPLGALLFSHPNMQRGEVEVLDLSRTLGLSEPLSHTHNTTNNQSLTKDNQSLTSDKAHKQKTTSWARRSIFWLDKRPLLVTEVFLPQILELKLSPTN